MIWIWLRAVILRIHWLFVPPLALPPRRIDQNAPCPICGHCKGKLTVAMNGDKPACRHTCLICGSTSFEDPVLPSSVISGATLKIAIPPATPAVTPTAAPTTPAR